LSEFKGDDYSSPFLFSKTETFLLQYSTLIND